MGGEDTSVFVFRLRTALKSCGHRHREWHFSCNSLLLPCCQAGLAGTREAPAAAGGPRQRPRRVDLEAIHQVVAVAAAVAVVVVVALLQLLRPSSRLCSLSGCYPSCLYCSW